MLRKAAVGFLACLVLYLAFSSYLRSQVRLHALPHSESFQGLVWSGCAVEIGLNLVRPLRAS